MALTAQLIRASEETRSQLPSRQLSLAARRLARPAAAPVLAVVRQRAHVQLCPVAAAVLVGHRLARRRRATFLVPEASSNYLPEEKLCKSSSSSHVIRHACPGDDPNVLSTREVYKLLKGAPSTPKALRLAARLRRAAREGRKLKDGRVLDAEIVDEALDALLEGAVRVQAAKKELSDRNRETAEYDDEDEDDEDYDDDEDEATDPYGAMSSKAAAPSPQRGSGRGMEEEPHRTQRAGPGRGSSFVPENEEDEEGVPPELMEQIIGSKFNIVDRVWQAPTASHLPKLPLQERSSVPETAWIRLPHIAVNGMTNVGKSTVINHVLSWNYAAKASSVPGKTKSIDFYCINNRFVLVDLPGYPDREEVAHLGVLKDWESHWEDLVFTYLDLCRSRNYDLRLLIQLQASRKMPSPTCKLFTAETLRHKLPMLLLLTKDDQLKRPHLERNPISKKIKQKIQFEGPHIHYSSKTEQRFSRNAKQRLIRWIRTAVSAKNSDEVREKLQAAWDTRKDSVHRQPARAVDKEAADEPDAAAAPDSDLVAEGKVDAPAAKPQVEQQVQTKFPPAEVQAEVSPTEASMVVEAKSAEEKKARTAVAIALERKLRRQRMSKIQLQIQRDRQRARDEERKKDAEMGIRY